MFICVVLDAPGDVGEELVRDVRNDDADGVRLAAAQGAGGVVGPVSYTHLDVYKRQV